MKNTILKLSLMLLTASLFSPAFAQVSNFERQAGYWTLGINGGMAYQQSDVPAILEGYGLGLTLAKNLYYRPGAAMTFDLRGRGLYTKTYGLDHARSFGIENNDALNGIHILDYTKADSSGFVYQNNQTDHVELGLEGVISFNKLREKTNVILSVFGGIGIDWYKTKIDQANEFGVDYSAQYESLNPTASVSFKKQQLRNAILDGVYETDAQGFENNGSRLGIMPSLGIELGYQFTPRFSMGIGHKVTFTKTDLFDGQKWKNDNTLTGDNDIHHYTNLHLRWILQAGEKELQPPVIEITKPRDNPHRTSNPNGFVKAKIKYVESAMDVKFFVNGRDQAFTFRKENFSGNIRLEEGRNDITISASNLAGTDEESLVIIYEKPVIHTPEPDRRPRVNITNPPHDNFRTDNENFIVNAKIENVSDPRNIYFSVDGRASQDFDFDSRSRTFSANIYLNEGRNDVRIEVRNSAGSDADETTIILEKRYEEPLPSVDIFKPYDDPFHSRNRRVAIEAKMYNVASKNDIYFTINGHRSSNFSFSNETLRANIDLNNYKTVVRIEAQNTAGKSSDETVLYFEEEINEPEIKAPVVTITSMSQPTIDPFDPDNCRSTVIATILNIENANDISFFLNGKRVYDFNFNPNTGVLQKTVRLRQGNNLVVITAQNEAGSAQDRASKNGCAVVKNPPAVTITEPGSISSTVTKPSAKIIATVLNINRKGDIDFIVNGEKSSNFSFKANTKIFRATISLLEGNNTLVIKASNQDGSAEDHVNITFKKPVVELPMPPKVTIQSPANKSNTAEKNAHLKAKILHVSDKNDITILLNGKKISNFSFNKKNRTASAQFSLKEGDNTIRVKATNEDGSDEKSVLVTFTPPTPKPPVVRFTKPATTVSNTTNSDANIIASVKNVRSKSKITLTLNGKEITDFVFKKNIFTADLKLKEGRNTVSISAVNDDGSDEATVAITYTPPLPKPTVVFVTPKKPGVAVKKRKNTIEATVKNVKSKKDITVKLNGKALKTFTFSPRNNKVTAAVSLLAGENTLFIEAKNASGIATANSTMRFVERIIQVSNPPTVNIISVSEPTVNPFDPNKAKSTILAQMENITAKNQITFTINGTENNDFSFDTKSQVFQTTINIVKGDTVILIKVENQDGSQEASRTITF